MTDTFSDYVPSLESPATEAFAITPSDVADLPFVTRALNVATNGTLNVTTAGGQTVSLFVVAGCAFPIRARKIWASGTTATGLVGLF